MSDYESMTYEELTALSIQLHDEYYALKGKLEAVKVARRDKGVEEEIKKNLASLSDGAKSELSKQLAQTIVPLSI